MKKNFFIITYFRLQKRDFERLGIKFFTKKKNLFIIELSKLLGNKSHIYYKKLKIKEIIEIPSLIDLIIFLRKNKASHSIVYLRSSFKELLIKFILFFFKVKIIKYLSGLKPRTEYDRIYHEKKLIDKIILIPNIFLRNIKKKIITTLNYFIIDTVMITGKKSDNLEYYLTIAKKKLYSHSFDYNYYIQLNKISKVKKKTLKKKYIVYLDQNFITHPDFFIRGEKPFVNIDFYKNMEKLFSLLKKKYKCDIKIAIHPKTDIKKLHFSIKKHCYLNKTAELIKGSSHVLAHYSTAISFAVLYGKSISFLTSKELKKVRAGGQIYNLAKMLDGNIINLDNFGSNPKINFKMNKKKYNRFIDDYVKHPKSSKENSWKYLLKNI